MNTKRYHTNIILLLIAYTLLIVGCKKKVEQVSTTRSFYMGTTAWPADFTANEVDTAYKFINNYCDIVSHHFDDGIPYDEAYNNRIMPVGLLQEINTRKTKTAVNKNVFLSVSALALTRIERAAYYANAGVADSIKNYWKQLAFNDPKIVAAYVNYVSWLITELKPIYVNYGVESNVLLWSQNNFNGYKSFLSQVYFQLKTKHPGIPFFISFIVDESNEGYNYAQQLLPFTDFIGLSAYPYITVSSSSNGNTDPKNFPANYFEKFANLSIDKPLAFAETGYNAEDLIISSFNLNKQGNVTWQKEYLEKVLKFCNDRKAKLFIWFCSKDYDAGSNTLRSLGLYQDIFGLWEDTGFKDENGVERPAYATWNNWVKMQRIE